MEIWTNGNKCMKKYTETHLIVFPIVWSDESSAHYPTTKSNVSREGMAETQSINAEVVLRP